MEDTVSPALAVSSEGVRSEAYALFRPGHLLPKVVIAIEWLVLLIALVYLGARSLPRAWRPLNTDFPNYYISARLLREGFSTDRIYEWVWIQRQKDHLGIKRADQPVVGFVPHTPFSALIMWPLTYLAPLTAKHIWIVVNLALLVAVAALLQMLTAIGWRRLVLLMALDYPVHRNLEYGQYYILLLLVVTLALWCYVREKRFLAGALMGIGFGLKIFPVLFVVYFARKRDLRAVLGLVAGGIAAAAASIWVFGWHLNRLYVSQVLPWALRGDAMDPYNLAASSLSSLLHRLLLFEPGWNPHPVVHSPALFSILYPLLQVAIFAPAILLAVARDWRPRHLQLEWSAVLAAVLAISSLPASYHFTLLVLPVAVMASELIKERDLRSMLLLALLYLAIGFPGWRHNLENGWWSVLAVPRLYFVILLCVLSCVILSGQRRAGAQRNRDLWAWAGALAIGMTFAMVTTFHHQRGLYRNYSLRIATSSDILLATNPVVQADSVLFTGLLPYGYRSVRRTAAGTYVSDGADDQFSQSAVAGKVWTEESKETSKIVPQGADGQSNRFQIENAEFPVASSDGMFLAYLRSTKGKSQIWLRSLQKSPPDDSPITPPELSVYEMSFPSDGPLVFAAAMNDGAPQLFTADLVGNIRPLASGEARYPSVSPDRRWLAYAGLDRGVWNLWLMDLHSGEKHRITNEECNDMTPAWEADSRTLVFASDCGRGLWFTALYRRRVVP